MENDPWLLLSFMICLSKTNAMFQGCYVKIQKKGKSVNPVNPIYFHGSISLFISLLYPRLRSLYPRLRSLRCIQYIYTYNIIYNYIYIYIIHTYVICTYIPIFLWFYIPSKLKLKSHPKSEIRTPHFSKASDVSLEHQTLVVLQFPGQEPLHLGTEDLWKSQGPPENHRKSQQISIGLCWLKTKPSKFHRVLMLVEDMGELGIGI